MKEVNSTEKKILTAMIRVYCKRVHGRKQLCADCARLGEYALKRLNYCVYGDEKPACRLCPVHCYSPAMREEIKKVMRNAGPGMMLRHPILSAKYFIKEKQKAG